jgi:predicted transcriptional regulator
VSGEDYKGVPARTRLLEEAIKWWQAGWNVIPIKIYRDSTGRFVKKPIIDWERWCTERQTLQDVESMPWAEANAIGGITGINGWVAVDADIECLEMASKFMEGLPRTRIHVTMSGGRHHIFKSKVECSTIKRFKKMFGIEVQGAGSFIVLPPSFNGAYKIENPDTPVAEVENLEALIYERARELGWKEPESAIYAPDEAFKGLNPREVKCLKFFAEHPFPEGRRELTVGKNFCILLLRTVEDPDARRSIVEWLISRQKAFNTDDILGWERWAADPRRKFNCAEVSSFMREHYSSFNCTDCPVRERVRVKLCLKCQSWNPQEVETCTSCGSAFDPDVYWLRLGDGREGVAVKKVLLLQVWRERGFRIRLTSLSDGRQLTASYEFDEPTDLRVKRGLSHLRKVMEEKVEEADKNIDFQSLLESIILILERRLESIKAAKVQPKTDTAKTDGRDEGVRKKALELLRDPAFFYKLGKVMERGFIVPKLNRVRFVIGEDRNKRLVPILVASSAKMGLTSIIRIIGDVATAKDTLLRLSLELLSQALRYVERGYLTPGGLRYSEEIHRADVLYIPDSPQLQGEMGRQLRLMRADDGGLVIEYAYKDTATGLMSTVEERLPVKLVLTSSNEIRIDPALESGAWTLETDNSPELTRRVQEEKLLLRAGRRPAFPEEELKIWKTAFEIALTQDVPSSINIPYADRLINLLSKYDSSQRRSPDKLCDLIEAVACFRRFQKPPETRGEADLTDLYIALQLGLEAMLKTVAPLDQREKEILEAVEGSGNSASVRDVCVTTKMAYNTAYKILEHLVDKGYLSKDKEKGRNVYSVTATTSSEEAEKLFSSLKKSPEDVFQLLKPVLSSDGNSSPLLGEGDVIKTVDPVTGEVVSIGFKNGRLEYSKQTGDPEWMNYPFNNTPTSLEEERNSKQSQEKASSGEKEESKLFLREKKSVLSGSGVPTKTCSICGKPIDLEKEAYTYYRGKLVHVKCMSQGVARS